MSTYQSAATAAGTGPGARRGALARVRTGLTVLAWAARAGMADHAVMFTLRTWILGWFMRMLAQVLFFLTIGNLLGPGQARYLLIGNAVLMVTLHGLNATASTTWELENGTLGLLVASPSSPTAVLAGRSLFWLPDGLACGLGAILILSPVAGLRLTAGTVLAISALMVVTALSSYCLGLFLGSLVLTASDLRNVVSNGTLTLSMALCGPEFPSSSLGPVLGHVGAFLPLTHGLRAVRDVFAGASTGHVAALGAQEAAVGCAWLAAAIAVLGLRARRSRHEGAALFLN
jgi:ABC-2 type transport system permease protein